MRTSLNNIQLTEEYLLGLLPPGDKLLFDANRVLDIELDHNVQMQQNAYTLVQQYGRKQLKAEIEAVHNQLFTNPQHSSFAQRILRLFR
ncbi:MAG: hypothetical protein EOP47_27175 [Sphingobacteriaceae bacterium]|nr:MAG: hypothetical protein EOP47_27175 [Sphingobacteriaceae bacterium]